MAQKKIAKSMKRSLTIVRKWLTRWKTDEYLGNTVTIDHRRTTIKGDDSLIIHITDDIEEPISK